MDDNILPDNASSSSDDCEVSSQESGEECVDSANKDEANKKKAKRKRTSFFERRNIRKIRSDNAIGEATREALEAEKARLARVGRLQRPKFEPKSMLNTTAELLNADDSIPPGFSSEDETSSSAKRPRMDVPEIAPKPADVIIVSEDDDDDEDAKKQMAEKRKLATSRLSKVEAAEDPDIIDLEDSDSESLNDGGTHVNDARNVPDEFGRVIINVCHGEGENDLFVAPQIAKALKPHQVGGIRFLYDNVIESTTRINQRGFGCILAHAMGLGKTIQIISFVDIAIRLAKFKTVLILVPINTIQNWASEFDRWLPKAPPKAATDDEDDKACIDDQIIYRQFPLFSITDTMKTFESRVNEVTKWREKGGVLLIGYEMFRIMVQREGSAARRPKPQKRKRKKGADPEPEFIDVDKEEEIAKMWDETFAALVQPGPDIVIADEGHRIKNEKAEISQKVKNIKTLRRIVLTGYPLQNNLEEYHCMVDFVRPNYLGSKLEFNNMFNRPITNGMCIDSTPDDKKLMYMRSHVLFDRLQGFVQRRSHKVLRDQLPEKTEYVIFLKMSDRQRRFYRLYMDSLRVSRVATWAQNNPLKAFAVSVKIMNHPDILYNACINKDKESIEDDFDGSADSPCSVNGARKQRAPRTPRSSSSSSNYLSADFQNIFDKDDDLWSKYACGELESGPKMLIFFDILESAIRRNERVLAFTQSLSTLDIVETFLNRRNIPGRDESWSRNATYFRLDGSTPPSERERMIKAFNDPDGQASLFLLSTRAGCLGINLTAANRVVVFDASWNPCHDCQAVCRVFRYGQTREVFVYRLIMDNTLERKIYERQIKKQSLSVRVVDETTPDQHFTRQQLELLMSFDDKDLNSKSPEELQSVEWKDPILRDVLIRNSPSITEMPFTHESLLIDKREFHLTSKEKREAHKEYESARKDASLYHGMEMNLGSQPAVRQSYANFYPRNGYSNPLLDPRLQRTSTMMKLHKTFENAKMELHKKQTTLKTRPLAPAPVPMQGDPRYAKLPGVLASRLGSNANSPNSRKIRPLNGKQPKKDIISVKEVNLPHDLSTPPTEGRQSITIPRGTKVKIIQTEKGTYLNYDNFMFALRSKASADQSTRPASKPNQPPTAIAAATSENGTLPENPPTMTNGGSEETQESSSPQTSNNSQSGQGSASVPNRMTEMHLSSTMKSPVMSYPIPPSNMVPQNYNPHAYNLSNIPATSDSSSMCYPQGVMSSSSSASDAFNTMPWMASNGRAGFPPSYVPNGFYQTPCPPPPYPWPGGSSMPFSNPLPNFNLPGENSVPTVSNEDARLYYNQHNDSQPPATSYVSVPQHQEPVAFNSNVEKLVSDPTGPPLHI